MYTKEEDSLLLRLERSQLRWCEHMTQMSYERTAKTLLCSTPVGRGAIGHPRTRWQAIPLKILVGLV